MDRKFFFFRREPESETSASFSDTGVGLSTIAIPSENLTFITAAKEKVIFTFKDCNGFDESSLQEGESIPKANITVACKQGDEAGLIEDVINFMSRSTPKNIMKFDVVEGKSTFDRALVDSIDDLKSVVPATPVNTFTGNVSLGDTQVKFQNTIADITFPGELPILDFNHDLISNIAEGGGAVSSIPNAGTAATGAFAFASSGVFGPSDESTLREKAVTIGSGASFKLGSDFNVTSGDYTIYVAANFFTDDASLALFGLGVLYQDTSGECFGFGGRHKTNGAINQGNDELLERRNIFSVRHAGITGAAPFASTLSVKDGTKSVEIPDGNIAFSGYNPNHVFIIRRDKNFNMFLHDRSGDIISKIPAKTNIIDPSLVVSSPGRTDGDLLFRGVGPGITNNVGKFYLNRFGIISSDIGPNNAANLAKQLFTFYGTK